MKMPTAETDLIETSILVQPEMAESPVVHRATVVSLSKTKTGTLLHRCLCLWVLALALYQFSETTADPDLWGHIVFGQQMLKSHAVERTEMYSWTANGQPFINHEYGADLIIGG